MARTSATVTVKLAPDAAALAALLEACAPFLRRQCSCFPPCEDADRRALREAVERVRAGLGDISCG